MYTHIYIYIYIYINYPVVPRVYLLDPEFINMCCASSFREGPARTLKKVVCLSIQRVVHHCL